MIFDNEWENNLWTSHVRNASKLSAERQSFPDDDGEPRSNRPTRRKADFHVFTPTYLTAGGVIRAKT